MVGTRAGGLKASKTNKAKNGEDFYARIGKKGGQNGHTGGFCSMTPERRSECGRKGGKASKRGPAKETKKTTKKVVKATPKFETAKPVINPEPPKAKPGIFKRLFGGK